MDGTCVALQRSHGMDEARFTIKTVSMRDLERWAQGLALAYPLGEPRDFDVLLRALDAVPWPPEGTAAEGRRQL